MAIGNELFGGEVRIFGAVDDVEEAEFDGVGHGDAEVQIPGRMENWSGGAVLEMDDGLVDWWMHAGGSGASASVLACFGGSCSVVRDSAAGDPGGATSP